MRGISRCFLGVALPVAALVLGCSGSDGGGSTAANGGAGGTGVGGNGGVTSAAGASGTAGGSGAPAARCSPGTVYEDPVETYAAGNLVHCIDYRGGDGGVPTSDTPGIVNVKLPSPTTAGQPYSFSIDVLAHDAPSIELWGTSAECGFGVEKLWAGSMPKGTFCTTLHPTKVDNDLLLVARGPIQTGTVAVCPGVTCPP